MAYNAKAELFAAVQILLLSEILSKAPTESCCEVLLVLEVASMSLLMLIEDFSNIAKNQPLGWLCNRS